MVRVDVNDEIFVLYLTLMGLGKREKLAKMAFWAGDKGKASKMVFFFYHVCHLDYVFVSS